MKKQTFISTAIILLFFMNSCTKTNTGVNNESLPPPGIAFQFLLIDKDSNTLYKYPNFLNTKYDPHKLYVIGQDGDTMKKEYLTDKPDSSSIKFDIDTLKDSRVFCILLYDFSINYKGNNIYYIHYNNEETDTLLVKPSKNLDEGGYFEYNNIPIYKYKGSKNHKGCLLFIK